jgi:hypothetical protein
MNPRSGSGRLGAIIDPTKAVNTASTITRGFINAMKWGSRSTKLRREPNPRRDKGIAVVVMVDSSTEIVFAKSVSRLATAVAASR